MKHIFLFSLILLSAVNVFAQQTIGSLINEEGAYGGYTLFTARHYHTSYLVNNEGNIINEWPQTDGYRVESCKLLETGQLLRAVNLEDSFYAGRAGAYGRLELVEWDGSVSWQFDYISNEHNLHHDFVPIKQADGSYTFLVSAWDVIDKNTAVAEGRDPAATGGNKEWILLEKILELKPLSNNEADIVWEWNMRDHLIQDFDDTKLNYGVVMDNPQLLDYNYLKNPNGLTNPDWNHVSGIDYNAELDQIVFTHHGANEIIIIDHSTTTAEAATHSGGLRGKGGDFLYRWGNPLVYRVGSKSDVRFESCHAPLWIPEGLQDAGKIMVLNNGYLSGISSIDVLTPPNDGAGNYDFPNIGTAFGPDHLDWTYIDGTSFSTSNMGNAQHLPNGNTMINEATQGRFFEVTPSNEIVWEYICPTIESGPLPYDVDISTIPNRNGDLENEVFQAHKYPVDFIGFQGKDTTPHGTVEVNETSIAYTTLKELEFKAYPNANADSIILDFTSGTANNLNVQIVNMRGQVIYTDTDIYLESTGKYTIPLSSIQRFRRLLIITVSKNQTSRSQKVMFWR